MRFSVITPSLNNLGGLRQCVGSVRGQHRGGAEHLIVDGGSTDGTVAWLSQLSTSSSAATPPQAWTAVVSPERGDQPSLQWISEPDDGMYAAIAKGWCHATGDVLSWLNTDEQYLPGTLARVASIFEARPDIDVVYGNTIIVTPTGEAIAARREIPLRRFIVRSTFLNIYSCTTFFRRRLLDKGLLTLDTSYRYAADMDLILRLLEHPVGMVHSQEFLSLFGYSGENLSLHLKMQQETQAVARAHGGTSSTFVRQLILALRRCERLMRGCYRPAAVEYAFATDETPSYIAYRAANLSGRFDMRRQVKPVQ